jgi:GTP cyclohydrolase II
MGQERIRLLSNNPEKARVLAANGIDVVEQVPHRIAANPHNADYLDTKRDRTGHQL